MQENSIWKQVGICNQYDEFWKKKMLPGLFLVKHGLPLNHFAIKVQYSLYFKLIKLQDSLESQNELYLENKKIQSNTLL